MPEELPASYYLMCSACRTPCPNADAHVLPRWNPDLRRIVTVYRCGNCWLRSLAELRATAASDKADVRMSFGDFLVRHGLIREAETIRGAPPGEQLTQILAILDALQAGTITLNP
jgi:hypothetical protein